VLQEEDRAMSARAADAHARSLGETGGARVPVPATGIRRALARVPGASVPGASLGARARAYFAADARRAIVSTLGLLWLLDGALQLQPYMFSASFLATLTHGAAGQPLWLESSITWGVHAIAHDLSAWNGLFAAIQLAIGLGLLYRPTVKPALALSFAWALVVWWFGEAFGMLFMMMAGPLTGAPGAAVLYALVGLGVWPVRRDGGLLGARGLRIAWGVLWLLMAWIWLEAQNSTPGAIAHAIGEAPSGMGWLTSVQHWAASAAQGNGVWMALLLAAVSAAIGVAVAVNWRPRPFLALAIALNALYWVVGQGFGGIFTGQGTDPNAGPLFILFACVLWALARQARPAAA
jgi:hypothetical protein